MPFSENLQHALSEYDKQKDLKQRLTFGFLDHPAIRALRRLSEYEQADNFKLVSCFLEAGIRLREVSSRGETRQVYFVQEVYYQVLSQILGDSRYQPRTNVYTVDTVLSCLAVSKLLTAENFKSLTEHNKGGELNFWFVQSVICREFRLRERATRLTQTVFDQLLDVDNKIIYTNKAYEMIWSRSHLDVPTSARFEELIECIRRSKELKSDDEIWQYAADTWFPREPEEKLEVQKKSNGDVSQADFFKRVRKNYLKGALECHPDKGGIQEEFVRLKEASDMLLDQKKCNQYITTP